MTANLGFIERLRNEGNLPQIDRQVRGVGPGHEDDGDIPKRQLIGDIGLTVPDIDEDRHIEAGVGSAVAGPSGI